MAPPPAPPVADIAVRVGCSSRRGAEPGASGGHGRRKISEQIHFQYYWPFFSQRWCLAGSALNAAVRVTSAHTICRRRMERRHGNAVDEDSSWPLGASDSRSVGTNHRQRVGRQSTRRRLEGGGWCHAVAGESSRPRAWAGRLQSSEDSSRLDSSYRTSKVDGRWLQHWIAAASSVYGRNGCTVLRAPGGECRRSAGACSETVVSITYHGSLWKSTLCPRSSNPAQFSAGSPLKWQDSRAIGEDLHPDLYYSNQRAMYRRLMRRKHAGKQATTGRNVGRIMAFGSGLWSTQ